MSKKAFHWRNDSGELDVFEAANYFNDYEASSPTNASFPFSHTLINDAFNSQVCSGEGINTDLPLLGTQHSSTSALDGTSEMQKPVVALKDRCKQPSSPGGRLACFLNSLFIQTMSSKKRNKKPKPAKNNIHDEDITHVPSGSMTSILRNIKRRSSSISDEVYATSIFKTSCNDDHRPGHKVNFSCGISEKRSVHWADECPSEKNNKCRMFEDDDDDDDDDDYSDSSSDLFDLPNSELLDYYSSVLPIYKTTQLDHIKRGTPISATVN